ncbi:MAG: UDP-N-acetylmuramoyl-tripeptide--D-alanyl-D-alanine ligase [Arenimonas sp.]|nr:UDP-N-acetylmuramoyl-tripeptide--D-alanyl-D-alanine ligase [Arenimonas sp.]
MRTMLLSEIAHSCEGRLMGADLSIEGVSIDSREMMAHGLFVALKGERYDAHDFVAQAKANGAAALLVHRMVETDLPFILCADTEEALGEIAAEFAKDRPAIVLALTGSNGKTSVKTMLHSILACAGEVYVNPGNRNNEIGLPLAVIDSPEHAQFAVYEMGAGKHGDIAYLTSIVSPNVALVNNIAPAHIERMGSLLGIAETKGAIYESLPDDGVAVVNVDDAFLPYFLDRIGRRSVLRFGLKNNADITARLLALQAEQSTFELVTPAGTSQITLAFPGQHNVMNALAASAMALAAGASFDAVVAGLHYARPFAGRQVVMRLANEAILIDDSYNANPGSVAAAIESLTMACALDKRISVLVLGDMAELGESAESLHAHIGALSKSRGIQQLYACGKFTQATCKAFGEGAKHFNSQSELIEALKEIVGPQHRVLVKGSRSSQMDQVVNAILAQRR